MTRVLRGPVTYDEFRRQVRRFKRSEVLLECARVNRFLDLVEVGEATRPGGLRAEVQAFAVAGVARTALIAANEFRTEGFREADLFRLCWFYMNVEDPDGDLSAGVEHLRRMLARMSHEQFGWQLSPMEQVGRSLVLFEDMAVEKPSMPTQDDWRRAYGGSVLDIVQVGFLAYAAGNVHEGVIPIEHMGDDRYAGVVEGLTPQQGLAVLDGFYTTTIDSAVTWARERERPRYEKWSPSPFVAAPIVILADGARVVPWPRLIVDRFSTSGLFYAGLEAFGASFATALGDVFEDYVGAQLGLLNHATVTPEVTYLEGGSEAKTCDWFVVTEECVVLVEVKATRPVLAVRTGEVDGLKDLERKVGRAADQLDATKRLIDGGHESVSHIPTDRPILGLVITLEPFFLLDSWLYEDLIGGKALPITVSYSHVLEGFAAVLGDRRDVGARLLDALRDTTGSGGERIPARLERAMDGIDDGDAVNPILERAWERITPTPP